MRNIKKSAIM